MSKGRSFVCDTLSSTIGMPANEPPATTEAGEPSGISFRTRRPNYIDEYAARARGIHASGERLYAGDKGFGKTTAMKSDVTDQCSYQAPTPDGIPADARLSVDNRKDEGRGIGSKEADGEWASVIGSYGCKKFDVRSMRIELIDPAMDEADMLLLAIAICAMAKGSKLSPIEKRGLRIALFTIKRKLPRVPIGTRILEQGARRLLTDDVKVYNQSLDAMLARQFNTDHAVVSVYGTLDEYMAGPYSDDAQLVVEAAHKCAGYLQLILDGEYGEMFAGTTTLADCFRQRATMFDFGDMADPQIEFFEMVRFYTLTAALKRDDWSVLPHAFVREEIHQAIRSVPLLESWAYWSATARARETQTYNSIQYLINMFNGPLGSRERQLCEQIYNGFDCLVLFQQPNDDTTQDLLSRRGLSERDIALTTTLPIGCALVKYKDEPAYTNQYLRTSAIKELSGSRQAPERMVYGRTPVDQDPRVRASRLGKRT